MLICVSINVRDQPPCPPSHWEGPLLNQLGACKLYLATVSLPHILVLQKSFLCQGFLEIHLFQPGQVMLFAMLQV